MDLCYCRRSLELFAGDQSVNLLQNSTRSIYPTEIGVTIWYSGKTENTDARSWILDEPGNSDNDNLLSMNASA
jgi:hypothetical protein